MENYEKYIVSTEEACTFLHRTSSDLIKKIIDKGLLCKTADIRGTATYQPENLNEARNLYNRGQIQGDYTIVIQIPKQLWEEARKENPGEETLDEKIGYLSTEELGFFIKPEFVKAYIDRKTNQITLI